MRDPHVHVAARRVVSAALVTLLAAVVELSVSRVVGSLFLASDAVHLVAHLGIFSVLLLPTHGAAEAREDIITCTILLLVMAIAIGITFRAVTDLIDMKPSPRPQALLFSLIGLGANLTAAYLLRDSARRHWSFRAALAHELSDASLTLVALVGAGLIALFHFHWVDAGLSLAVAIWLGVWAMRLLVQRFRSGRSAWEM